MHSPASAEEPVFENADGFLNRPRFRSVDITLFGRFMLSSKREYPCQIRKMSAGEATIVAPVPGETGERVVLYVEYIGRVEGSIVRPVHDGFVMDISATPHKRNKLADQLTYLLNQHLLKDENANRRHERLIPRNPFSRLVLEDGREYACRVLDMSVSGAAVAVAAEPESGTTVYLNEIVGNVVRRFDEGIAIEFLRVQDPEALKRNFF